jgi:hypothetical protein
MHWNALQRPRSFVRAALPVLLLFTTLTHQLRSASTNATAADCVACSDRQPDLHMHSADCRGRCPPAPSKAPPISHADCHLQDVL